MQHDFATTAAQTDIPQVGAARRYETKNCSALKTKDQPRKKSRLLRTTTKNEYRTMDQNNGLEAKTSKGETRITIMMDLQEVFPHLIRISLQGQTSHMRTVIRTIEDHMINAQIIHSIETMEIDLKMDLLTTRMGTDKIMETFPVLHWHQGEISHKTIHTANQEVIKPTTLPSADLKNDLRLFPHLTNKSSHKTIIRYHLMCFASLQLTIPLMSYQIFARYTTKVSELEHRQISKFKT